MAWTQLIDWVVWLHDRYELSIEERIPPCWPQHPGLVEELWALMIWRTEIYDRPNRAAGDTAHSWHRELRAFVEITVPFYARTCRAGHAAPSTWPRPTAPYTSSGAATPRLRTSRWQP
ncbi:hypothetical protein ACFQ9X_17665 [Catenulispora yoronensis]